MNLTLCKIILWLTEFEIAFTPRSAKHYARLKQDRTYWQGELMKAEINRRGAAR